MSGKWTKECEMQQYLESLFESGELKDSDKPKDIYELYTAFGKYSLDVFRKNFNQTKKKFFNVNPTKKPAKVTPKVERRGSRQSSKKGERLISII